MHLHNIYHHLSPSVLRPLRARGIAAVMTLHDYKLACPTYRFLANGQVCEACVPRRFYMASLKRCHEGSLSMSTLNGIELAAHTLFRMYEPVDLFLCPSRFMMAKMAAAHVFPRRLRWVPNFVDASASTEATPSGRVVFAGSLSEEKGVETLVRAAADVDAPSRSRAKDPSARARRLAQQLGATNMTFHGRRTGRGPRARARFRGRRHPISRVREPADGRPRGIRARGTRGRHRPRGIPELVRHGIDGFLVAPDDHLGLATALNRFTGDPRTASPWRAGRRRAETDFAPDDHLDRSSRLSGGNRARRAAETMRIAMIGARRARDLRRGRASRRGDRRATRRPGPPGHRVRRTNYVERRPT